MVILAIGVKPEPGANILELTDRLEAVVNQLNAEKLTAEERAAYKALAKAAAGESLVSLHGGCDWNALEMIDRADADVMCEITYTDIETGQPATDHIRAALDRG